MNLVTSYLDSRGNNKGEEIEQMGMEGCCVWPI